VPITDFHDEDFAQPLIIPFSAAGGGIYIAQQTMQTVETALGEVFGESIRPVKHQVTTNVTIEICKSCNREVTLWDVFAKHHCNDAQPVVFHADHLARIAQSVQRAVERHDWPIMAEVSGGYDEPMFMQCPHCHDQQRQFTQSDPTKTLRTV